MTWQTRTYKLSGPNARAASPDGEMTATQIDHLQRKKPRSTGSHRHWRRAVLSVALAAPFMVTGWLAYLDATGGLISIEALGNTKVIATQGTTATADKAGSLAVPAQHWPIYMAMSKSSKRIM